jgi:hypothetical protein
MDQQQPPASPQPPQAQWTPPQQPSGWQTPDHGAPPRPTGVTLASIFLIVMGVLFALSGAACGLIGGGLSSINPGSQPGGNPFPVIGGMIVVVGIIVLILGLLSIAGGAGALGGKSWGRWIGIVVSVVFVVLSVLLTVSALGSLNQPDSGGVTWLVFWVAMAVAYALCAYALVAASAYFSYRR